MIHVDVEGFLIHVPLKHHMSAEEFLAIADKLASVTGHMPGQYRPAPSQEMPAQQYQPEPAQQYQPEPVQQYAPRVQAQPVQPPVMQEEWQPPIQKKSTAHERLAAPTPLPEPEPAPTMDTLRFDREEEMRMQHMLNQIRSQMGQLKNTEDRLDSHEMHLKQILSYLQSLDKHLRK